MFGSLKKDSLVTKEIPVSGAKTPETNIALEYWSGVRGSCFAPRWRDINLIDLPLEMIPRIIVVDVIPEPLDFAYRFFGTWHAQCLKREMTGKKVSSYEDEVYMQTLFDEYVLTLKRREPALFSINVVLNDIPYVSESLRLPLSSDGETVDGIMVVESLVK